MHCVAKVSGKNRLMTKRKIEEKSEGIERERKRAKKTFYEICMDETRKVISQLFDIYRRQYLTLKNNLNIDILVARYCSDVMCRSGTSALSAWCQWRWDAHSWSGVAKFRVPANRTYTAIKYNIIVHLRRQTCMGAVNGDVLKCPPFASLYLTLTSGSLASPRTSPSPPLHLLSFPLLSSISLLLPP